MWVDYVRVLSYARTTQFLLLLYIGQLAQGDRPR